MTAPMKRNGQSIAQGGKAMVFLSSMRGQYMEFLRDSLFNLYPLLREGYVGTGCWWYNNHLPPAAESAVLGIT